MFAILALLSLGVVGVLDYLTGYQISFAVFYLVPVGVAAWYGGRNWGVALSLVSSVTWYIVERGNGQPYDHMLIPVWNAYVRFMFFLVTSLLLSELRQRLLLESRLARTDSLTGLLNSRAFTEQLEHDLALNERAGSVLTVVYIDLDDFKSINDHGGHGEGDRQLQRVAGGMLATIRRTDSAGRLGGDEFALILPQTTRQGAAIFLEKLADQLRNPDGRTRGVNCSIGALTIEGGPATADQVIGRADSLMYAAKRGGKNRILIEDFANAAPTGAGITAGNGPGTPPQPARE